MYEVRTVINFRIAFAGAVAICRSVVASHLDRWTHRIFNLGEKRASSDNRLVVKDAIAARKCGVNVFGDRLPPVRERSAWRRYRSRPFGHFAQVLVISEAEARIQSCHEPQLQNTVGLIGTQLGNRLYWFEFFLCCKGWVK